MLKRIFPLVAVLALLMALVAVPVSAAGEYQIVDYNDYKANADVNEDEDTVSIQFPSHMVGIDYTIFGPNGKTSGSVAGGDVNVTLYKGYDSYIHYQMPFFADGYLMDFQNIPDGSVFRTSLEFCFMFADDVRYGTFSGHLLAQIEYYDADFNYVGTDYGQDIFIQDGGVDTHISYYSTSIIVDKPQGAVYGYVSFPCNAWTVTGAYGYYPVSFNFYNVTLDMSIDSLYLLWEETGRTNELLEDIINGEVTPEAPAGSESVGELDDIEGALKDDTAAGREEAEQIFNESSGLVASHISGFLFLSDVIERFISVGWLRGILTVSLSLGIFGFIANIAMIAARNGRDGRDGKDSKGG